MSSRSINYRQLHRCRECGGIAEWHYILASTREPMFSRTLGEKCFGPGQPTSGGMHTLDYDPEDSFPESSLRRVVST